MIPHLRYQGSAILHDASEINNEIKYSSPFPLCVPNYFRNAGVFPMRSHYRRSAKGSLRNGLELPRAGRRKPVERTHPEFRRIRAVVVEGFYSGRDKPFN